MSTFVVLGEMWSNLGAAAFESGSNPSITRFAVEACLPHKGHDNLMMRVILSSVHNQR